MLSLEQLFERNAEELAAKRSARQAEILAGMPSAERDLFDGFRRSGASFGIAQVALATAKQRAAKLATRQAPATPAKPTAPPATRPGRSPAALSFPKPATGKSYPTGALQLRAGSPFELLASAGGSAGPVVARVLARSGKGIPHPYWTVLVHDLTGREQLKSRLPLDYCHDSGQILGYAEDWRTEAGNLACTATLLPGESDRAREVIDLARRGVPFEASISFWPLAVEKLEAGRSATVNGQLVTGPASVIRRWRLTGLAVCPRGADPHTKTELPVR